MVLTDHDLRGRVGPPNMIVLAFMLIHILVLAPHFTLVLMLPLAPIFG